MYCVCFRFRVCLLELQNVPPVEMFLKLVVLTLLYTPPTPWGSSAPLMVTLHASPLSFKTRSYETGISTSPTSCGTSSVRYRVTYHDK